MSDEQRSFVRLPVDFDVEMYVNPKKKEQGKHSQRFVGQAVNISDDGLLVKVSDMTPDTKENLISGKFDINLSFDLSAPEKKIDSTCEIVRLDQLSSKQNGLGIRLKNISKEDKD